MKWLFILLCSQVVGNTVVVVFGATGDLTSRKIIPAIERLREEGALPEPFTLVGMARRSEKEFRKQVKYPLLYVEGDFDDEGSYKKLGSLLKQINGGKNNVIYFLATQPKYFSTIVEQLDMHGLIYEPAGKEWSRVMIEKPFGHDLTSALELQEAISEHLDVSQIYRIDHYLGKEGVQNLIDFRTKGEFESIWNQEFIERVEITLSEEIGVGTRGKFWEETGMLRDVVQNHVMQLLSLVAMEMGDDLPREKIKAVQAIREIDSIQRGQYTAGIVNGTSVLGYREEADVSHDSKVETFVKAELYIDNDRWEGVPFYIQAGKRLSKQRTEIVVHFKSGKVLHMRVQPNPAIYFEGEAKMAFDVPRFSEGYQKLIYDCVQGNQALFVQKEEQIASWRLLTPVLEAWKKEKEIPTYPAGIDL